MAKKEAGTCLPPPAARHGYNENGVLYFGGAGAGTVSTPCTGCPWRTANHGTPHPGGFYRRTNLRRLWARIRQGGGIQSCHPTDPGHPDHMKFAGAKEGLGSPGMRGQRDPDCAGVVRSRRTRRGRA